MAVHKNKVHNTKVQMQKQQTALNCVLVELRTEDESCNDDQSINENFLTDDMLQILFY